MAPRPPNKVQRRDFLRYCEFAGTNYLA